MLCALAGAYLVLALNPSFIPNMTAGRGYMALAAMIFGKWHPIGALLACLLFGLLEAVAIRLQGVVVPGIGEVPVQAIQALPYVRRSCCWPDSSAGPMLPRHWGCRTSRNDEGTLMVDDATLQRLVEAAREARGRAHAPYSKFAVGAALLDEQGRIHAGCNIENAAYPESLCAPKRWRSRIS